MEPRIEILEEKKLIGNTKVMSIANNKTKELWSGFAPRIQEIEQRVSNDKISMQIYNDLLYFKTFDPYQEFLKWAAVEVENFNNVPENMDMFVLEGGMYAVFDYKGLSNDFSVFQYIFTEWLPNSAYELDKRPHFEVLGEKYQNNDPNSEEEIWIPIK